MKYKSFFNYIPSGVFPRKSCLRGSYAMSIFKLPVSIFNRAMLGKQVWRLATSPSALWSKVMKGIYFPHGDVWTASKGHRPSWGWHSLILGRDTIKENTKWSVGDGKSIRIREDKWLSQGVIGGEVNQTEPSLVSELINEESREWKQQLIHQLYEERVAKEILAVPLSHQPQPDMLIWTGNRTGQYSVKSGYNRAIINTNKTDHNRPSCSYQPPRTLWTQIWSLDVPPKVRSFLWSICQNAIPTRENLNQNLRVWSCGTSGR